MPSTPSSAHQPGGNYNGGPWRERVTCSGMVGGGSSPPLAKGQKGSFGLEGWKAKAKKRLAKLASMSMVRCPNFQAPPVPVSQWTTGGDH